jgi:putative transposase
MAHCNTIFSQILKLVPRHEFESLAKQHHSGRSFRTASRWSQFVSLSMAQLAGRNSLRDIVDNMSAQSHRLYHLGSTKLSRSNLSRINEDKPYCLYEALFGKLQATIFASRTHFIHSMLLPSISACPFSPGRTSVQPRGPSSSMSG